MATNKTLTINGRLYDAVTGLPIEQNNAPKAPATPAKTRPSATTSAAVHTQTQRAQTLRKRAEKKPVPTVAKRPATARHMDFARSSKITRFAPHPVAAAKPVSTEKPDKAPQIHPTASRALERHAAKKPVVSAPAKPATAKQVKDEAISKALAKPKDVSKKKKTSKWPRRLIIVGLILAILLLSLYAVYRFIPSVSVGIASAQANVKATYPEYVPDGFGLSQPVTYSDGEVVLKFKSNSNDISYLVKQTRSSWDSSAVLDNVVRPATGENYVTTKERGLTIYSYKQNAAWVNGGVLYVIEGNNAPLSGEQIRRIATSL